MRVPKGLRTWPVLFALIVSALVIACTTQPTATTAPTATTEPAATAEPTATEPAATDTPVPPTETAEPTAMPTEETATPPPPTDTPVPTAEPTAVPTPTEEPTPAPATPAEVEAIAGAAPGDVVSAVLAPENDSGQTGWATLIARGDQTEVILSLSEGALETEAVHIHSGQCGDSLGGVVHPLTSFAGGSGYSVTTVDAELASLRNGDFAINTHQSGDPSVYTSCANIPTADQSVTLALNEENDSGQSGVATLTARGAQTDVVLHLSPGDLETQAVHIHSGQCGDSLGGVVHPLTSFVGGAGASVTTINVPLNSVQTGDFAVNTHQSGNPSVYTSCGNIPRNSDTITVPMEEENQSGQTGVAMLTPRGDDTEVWLSLSEGDMESSAVHIHSGQCGDSLGGVVHPLTNIDGGTSATLIEGVSVESLLTGGFAVNSHNAQDSSIYTACGNVPGVDVNMVSIDFAFDIGELQVQAGDTFTLHLANDGERPHNIFFHGIDEMNADDERADRLQSGDSRTRQFVFNRPGIYPFYCPVGSHEDAGMIGVLRVTGPSDGDPTITLNAPSPNRELEGPEILFGATVTNFDIDEEDATSGRLKVSLDGVDLGSASSIVGALDNVAPGEHTVTAELLNSYGPPLNPPVQSSLTFTVEAGNTPVGSPMLGVSPTTGLLKVTVAQ